MRELNRLGVTGLLDETIAPGPPDSAPKHRTAGWIIAVFAAGCAAGAFGFARGGFVVLVVPAAIARAVRARLPRGP